MEKEPGAIEVRLSRDLTFLSATMMGIGATVGAGVFVVFGFAAGVAGPALLLAILLNGLVAGLTATNSCRGIPTTGRQEALCDSQGSPI